MTYNPKTLRALGAYWITQGGTNLGVVGDAAHAKRASYHNGRDRIVQYGRMATDYSVRTKRDRDGLTDAASAIDLGRLANAKGTKTLGRLRKFSVWLVEQCRANAPGTRDVREVIYSPDGDVVLRWDRERGYASKPRAGEADSSHLTHTHISFYRDSESRDKVALFRGFFGGDQEEIVESFTVPKAPAAVCTVPAGTKLYTSSELDEVAWSIDPGRDMPYLGEPIPGVALVHRTDEQGAPTGVVLFAKASAITNVRPAPSTAADCAEQVAAAEAAGRLAGAADEKERLVRAAATAAAAAVEVQLRAL